MTYLDCNTIQEVADLVNKQDSNHDRAAMAGWYAFDAANDQRHDCGGFVTTEHLEGQADFLAQAGASFDALDAVRHAGLIDAEWHAAGAVGEMSEDDKINFLADPESWRDGLSMWPMWSEKLAFGMDDFLSAITEAIENE